MLQRTGRQNRSCWGVDTSGKSQDIRERWRRVNAVEILGTHYENGK
jgi:hypothetical protein